MSVFHTTRRQLTAVACIAGLSVGASLIAISAPAGAATGSSSIGVVAASTPRATGFTVESPLANAVTTAAAGTTAAFPNAELVVTGAGEDGADVRLLRANGKEGGRGTVQNGRYSFSADVNWGTWTFTVQQRLAGQSSWTDSTTLDGVTIARQGSQPFALTSPLDGDTVDSVRVGSSAFPNARVRFTGTGTVGDTITVLRSHNGKVAGTTTVGEAGHWSLDTDFNFGTWGAVVLVDGKQAASVPSFTITEVDDATAPSVPKNLSTSKIDATTVHVMWSASSDDVAVDHYEVERNGEYLQDADTTMLNIGGHTPGQTYDYRIRAVDAAGNASEYSAVSSITLPPADTEAPTKPANLRSADITADSLTVNWTASQDNSGVDHYVAALTADGKPAGSKTVTSPSAIFTGLDADTEYLASVTAVDAAGNTSDAATLSVTTSEKDESGDPTRGVPKDFRATAGVYPDGDLTLNRIVLDWTPDEEATRRYEIWIDGKRWQTLLVDNAGDPWVTPSDDQHRYLNLGDESPVGHSVKLRAQLDGGSWSAFTPELTVQ